MKSFHLKKYLTFIFALIAQYTDDINAQPIVSPSPNTEICPSNINAPTNITLTFNFGSNSASNYSIPTYSLKGCSIISNIDQYKQAVVQFSDKKETHEFKVYNSSVGAVVGTYTYTKIKTLDGVKGAFSVPLPVTPPPGFDDILTSNLVGVCKTNTFRYNSPVVRYKDASGVDFGTLPMNFYEWVIPKGWKVFSNVSDGVTPIITGGPFADITPDQFTTGEFKIRAENDCNPFDLLPSTWFKVALDRPAIKLVNDKSSIICGDQGSINFSLQNASFITCVNSYTWNIGLGWLLANGNPAPSTYSTGTTSSLTLTPSCGKALGSISVTIVTSAGNYNTNSNAIIITQPSMSINGSGAICTSNSFPYFVNSLPCNASVLWNITPATGIVNLSCSTCNQTILTRVPNATGSISINASITGLCGLPAIAINKLVVVGIPVPSINAVKNSGPGEPTDWQFTATPFLSGLTYNWYVGNTLQQGETSNVFNYYYPCNVSKTVKCSISNACGLSPFSNSITKTGECTRDSRLTLSPNPATHTVAISLIPIPSSQSKSILETFNIVRIYDQQGNIKKYQKGSKISQIIINVDNLNKGVYIVEITDGYYKERQKLIIQK